MTIGAGKIVKYRDEGRDHPFVVYMAVNRLNGRFYIGATEKGTQGRAAIHKRLSKYKGQRMYFARAINKYGFDAFRFLTIKDCVDWQDALASERQYIALLKPHYNLTHGGGGVKGYRHSPQSISKMSAAKKGKPGRKMTEEMRAWLSLVKTGVKLTPSDKQKEACIRTAKLGNAARRKKVICVTDGIVYNSLTEAAERYQLTTGQISYHCSGDHRSRRGLKFRYLDGDWK